MCSMLCSFIFDAATFVLLLIFHVSSDLEPLPAERHPSQQKDPEQRLREPGANDSGSTAPRSTEGSISEDVFTETELSPIREEEQASNEDLRLDKSSGASTESVKTITQVEATSASSQDPGSTRGSVSQPEEPTTLKAEDNPPDTATENSQSPMGSKQHSVEKPPSTPTTTSSSTSQAQGPSSSTSHPGSQSSATPGATGTTSVSSSPQGDANEGPDVSKTDTMQQGKDEKENVEQTPQDGTQNSAEGKHTYSVTLSNVSLVENRYRTVCVMKLALCCLLAAILQPYSSEDYQSEFLSTVAASESLLSCCLLITFRFALCLGASNCCINTKGNRSLSVVIRLVELAGLYGALCSSLISGSGGLGLSSGR